jgi:transportin-3
MARMVSCFNETGYACYLWIVGKVSGKLGDGGNEGIIGVLNGSFAGVTEGLGGLLNTKTVVEIPDG